MLPAPGHVVCPEASWVTGGSGPPHFPCLVTRPVHPVLGLETGTSSLSQGCAKPPGSPRHGRSPSSGPAPAPPPGTPASSRARFCFRSAWCPRGPGTVLSVLPSETCPVPRFASRVSTPLSAEPGGAHGLPRSMAQLRGADALQTSLVGGRTGAPARHPPSWLPGSQGDPRPCSPSTSAEAMPADPGPAWFPRSRGDAPGRGSPDTRLCPRPREPVTASP